MGGWNRWSYHLARDISKTLNDPNVVSSAEMRRRQAASEKQPEQKIIEDVLAHHLSNIDIIHYGQEHKMLQGPAGKAIVQKWCNEFNVPCNMISANILAIYVNHMDKTVSREPDVIRAEIKEKLEAHNEAEKKAQEAYDALPWHQKVNWMMVIYCSFAAMGLLSLLFGN
ncbi:hypothetical protein LJB76_01535 [Clostridia bacterium OttesenSCG-928-O13]|nr:hypothetical protein [Clostridia bacterium OttesenSCG-928-O13]